MQMVWHLNFGSYYFAQQMFKLLDAPNNPTKRRTRRNTTIIQKKHKTSVNLTTQFESGQWTEKLVEDAEDNFDLEFQNARKAVHLEMKKCFPDTFSEMEYKDCLFKVQIQNSIEHLRRLRELHPEDDIDARRFFQIKSDINEAQKKRGPPKVESKKISSKFQEFNIKMQGRQLSQFLDMREEPYDAIVHSCFMWKVPATQPKSGLKPRIIACPDSS